MYLVDTDILVDSLRGNEDAANFIRENSENIKLSVLTIAELYAGTRSKSEERILAELLMLFPKIAVTEQIAEKAGLYRNRYGKSHGTGLVDSLIVATAEAENATFITLNKKHYPMLDSVKVPYKKG